MDMTAHAQRRRERATPSPDGAVRLHIEHLVLRGVAPAEAGRLRRALEAELAHLAVQPGTQFQPITADRLPTAPIVAGRLPEQTGRSVASTVWAGIAPGGPKQ
ncbi:MAG TPA: hypothetical protein VKI44_16245 [Acetobacteraceae bacterium]|nr:hypothetical protein [Acetobacteraceae bacterium]